MGKIRTPVSASYHVGHLQPSVVTNVRQNPGEGQASPVMIRECFPVHHPCALKTQYVVTSVCRTNPFRLPEEIASGF